MGLILDAGSSSRQGRRPRNEDACLIVTPSTGNYAAYGALFAVADGVGGLPDGQGASSSAIRVLRDGYYATPESWSLEHALVQSIQDANHAVITGGERGRATTLSALVLRNRQWLCAHVGDTRVWLLRAGQLQTLTRDHHLPHADIGSLITRACGLDENIHPDITRGELAEGDVFLLTSDGVHEYLDTQSIARHLSSNNPAQDIADALTQAAYVANSHDNLSACVLRIEKLPHENDGDLKENIAALPILPLPEVKDAVDDFHIDERVHNGRMSTLYKAIDLESGETVVLKFPNPRYADDPAFVQHFLREEWIGRRIDSPHLVKVLPLKAGRRTRLYSVMACHPGETLGQRIRRKHGLAIKETLHFAQQLLKGLDHLHRKGVIHRDVKPDNILVDVDNHLRLIDLGVSRIERLDRTSTPGSPIGTPSYMAPELFSGEDATEAADVYSTGVTLYEMLTEKFPYGEIEPFSHPRFQGFAPPERYNPDIPPWLSDVLRKACAAEPKERYANGVEFAHALANPAPRETVSIRKLPLLERIPPGRWKLLFMISLLLNVLMLLMLILA